MSRIGERIRSARKAAGLTQAQLASQVGVVQSAVAGWESEEGSDPYTHRLVAIARACGVSVAALLEDPEDPAAATG